ncbi:Uncharacterized conserved protein UCP019262 [Methanothermus fervidus DSM 2088]|uniref:Uncharacterized conserved protein UCP019262 n=1 Tax=Methanothermus fervidus (strain ATCC 43054 / DSM 2088 / JCM 10308 / V24 S) TaxID=523846 RepID=E3GZ98_METFV|nr:DUF2121 domain-containing protein [Methanothermus fervidus]ADP77630.1 Uncharacterized conserved protein UCP019262 [Methanothermus fervidus DSM 2088]
MSLILAYVGKKGCVIAGDKRKIAYFGDKSSRKILEEKLYTGKIKTLDELFEEAKKLGVSINITDNAKKVREKGHVAIGEVGIKATHSAKRRRLYATTNCYEIIELEGSKIVKRKKGNSALIVFGNRITKKISNEILKKEFNPKMSLQEIANLFKKIIKKASELTPTINKSCDIVIKNPILNKEMAEKILEMSISEDIKNLRKWRKSLKDKMIKAAKEITLASKIITEGDVGEIVDIKDGKIMVKLNQDVCAYDLNWEKVANPGEIVTMTADNPSEIKVGDKVVIENEELYVERCKEPLQCEVILTYCNRG